MKLTQQLRSAKSTPYQFPQEAFEILKKNDYLPLPRFRDVYSSQDEIDETSIILQDLIAIGEADLAVGRIYEGHINALLLIDEYGTSEQRNKYFKDAKNGKIFGIWNTERSFEAMTISKKNKNFELKGAKTFCSGGLDISRPIITAQNDDGKQMVILEIKNHKTLYEDKSLWKVLGMESTVSHRIDFSGIEISSEQLLGKINDYDSEPMISTGAIRFAAVQFGAAKDITNITIQHLKKQNRANHPIQNQRIAELGILIKTGNFWFEFYSQIDKTNHAQHINYVNMVRTDILRICEAILSIAEKAIGVQGFLEPHPFVRKYRDLKVYLKQPNPDLAMAKIGQFFTENGIS